MIFRFDDEDDDNFDRLGVEFLRDCTLPDGGKKC